MPLRLLTLSLLLLLVVGVGMACALAPSGSRNPDYPPPSEDAPPDIKAVWEVWNILMTEHIVRDGLSAEEITEAAIQAMLDVADDPYAAYLPSQAYQMQEHGFSGAFEGIGAKFAIRDERPVIIAPLPNTPAQRAGIRPGDVILAVDGVTTEGMSLQEVALRIRGTEGTPVTLLVQHVEAGEPVEITIVRGVITLQTVSSQVLEDNIGYIHLHAFHSNTNELLTRVLETMQEEEITGIILDLRNNPGGLVGTTVQVASQFLREGLVLYQVDGTGQRVDLAVTGDPLFPDIPLVVLVNSYSASGSEVLAGALQDHGRALLVGTTTFGKGSVNVLRGLSNGGGLYFSFARWYTPNGRLIEGQGLDPDIQVEEGDPDSEADPHLERAVEALKERMAVAVP